MLSSQLTSELHLVAQLVGYTSTRLHVYTSLFLLMSETLNRLLAPVCLLTFLYRNSSQV